MNPFHLGFAGFRHVHIFDLYQRALAHPALTISGAWENDPGSSLLPGSGIDVTCQSFDELLSGCDAVAIGDCYGRRGALVIAALRAGRHVIADKPLCTSLGELEQIQSLARAKGLSVGMMLDLRDHGNLIALREAVRSGRIGAVQTVSIAAQHPLLWGMRPDWYFQKGMHGGTLNDIAIHAVDFIPWITGLSITGIDAARTWNAKASGAPDFHDCGQFMLRLSNGGGVIGDVSYLAPDSCGYSMPNYWRITVHGSRGLLEISWNSAGVTAADDDSKGFETLPSGPGRPGGYLEDFLCELKGRPRSDGITTESCFEATRLALQLESQAI